jgi:nucleoside-diphosphate-sugar epimerase
MSPTFFLFGAGYSARTFARLLPPEVTVFGTTRTPDRFETLREARITPLLFDGTTLSTDTAAALGSATHLVVSAAPGADGDPVLAAAGYAIRTAMPDLRWIGYLSTVGVYGDHGGAWVDETAECRPASQRSRQRLAAEHAWQTIAEETGRPLAILRLSGIYGPGRNAFVNLAAGTARRLVKPGQVFNRIHVDDIAGALLHLSQVETGGIFNVTDDLPAPPQDVVAAAADIMGVPPPPETSFETAQLSPMARSFYGENKRVSNARLKETGYRFRHPDYHAAFAAMWASDTWRGDSEGQADPS